MTPEEFHAWKRWTEMSGHRWTMDPVHDGKGDRDLLLHIGGENGKYLRFSQDGTLEMGYYEGAVPHIGEATFRIEGQKKFKDRNEAFVRAIELGGLACLLDLVTTSEDRDAG